MRLLIGHAFNMNIDLKNTFEVSFAEVSKIICGHDNSIISHVFGLKLGKYTYHLEICTRDGTLYVERENCGFDVCERTISYNKPTKSGLSLLNRIRVALRNK